MADQYKTVFGGRVLVQEKKPNSGGGLGPVLAILGVIFVLAFWKEILLAIGILVLCAVLIVVLLIVINKE